MRSWLAVLAASLALPASASAKTDATYYNDAAIPAADPYVLQDPSGDYYAYSTEGAGKGYHFAIYRSPDLVTWKQVPGGALPEEHQWGNDWFWAPEVYRNPRTGLYFLFYAARSDANAKRWFGFANFEEPCKIGVAVSRSPKGPFHNISDQPIDYNPYDPDYHDVNQLMGPDQKKPPATLEQGQTAPLGVYIPTIDPNVYFAPDGRQYLYFSRNAYRNWNWDPALGKYIEESNILAVELTTNWWNDPTGRTMPTIAPAYRNAKASPGGPSGPRRDGWTQIISYQGDPQPWENAHVNDYATSGGEKKDRRWEEGSTTFAHAGQYYLTYSANNWESPFYGVGYAVAPTPLGPFKKAPTNPILAQNPQLGMYSTGHGSVVASPDGRELYYVHHGRPTPDAEQRRLYTERMRFSGPVLSIDQATGDRPMPSGVEPFKLTVNRRALRLRVGESARLSWRVTSRAGAQEPLSNPLNRVAVDVARSSVATVRGHTVTAHRRGRTTITLTYQRKLAAGGYRDVIRRTVSVVVA